MSCVSSSNRSGLSQPRAYAADTNVRRCFRRSYFFDVRTKRGSDAGNDASRADSGNDSAGGTLTVATFDSPSPPGSADSLVGAFSGLDFGNQWRWSGPYGADPTNHVYFATDTCMTLTNASASIWAP
jgi:hypothetical protein